MTEQEHRYHVEERFKQEQKQIDLITEYLEKLQIIAPVQANNNPVAHDARNRMAKIVAELKAQKST